MRQLVVRGGRLMVCGKQIRVFVATRTKKKIIELLTQENGYCATSIAEINNYWSETHNDVEVSVALNSPDVVFTYKTNRYIARQEEDVITLEEFEREFDQEQLAE